MLHAVLAAVAVAVCGAAVLQASKGGQVAQQGSKAATAAAHANQMCSNAMAVSSNLTAVVLNCERVRCQDGKCSASIWA